MYAEKIRIMKNSVVIFCLYNNEFCDNNVTYGRYMTFVIANSLTFAEGFFIDYDMFPKLQSHITDMCEYKIRGSTRKAITPRFIPPDLTVAENNRVVLTWLLPKTSLAY